MVSLGQWSIDDAFSISVTLEGKSYGKSKIPHSSLVHSTRRCGAKGCECGSGHDQDQAHHPVRGLVPHWLQVRHQLSATYCAGAASVCFFKVCLSNFFRLGNVQLWEVFSNLVGVFTRFFSSIPLKVDFSLMGGCQQAGNGSCMGNRL